MSWSDPGRRLVLLGLLAGCGFTPVYAPGGPASLLRAKTAITAPRTVAGYRLLQALRDRLGPAPTPLYDLTVTVTSAPVAAATSDAGTARYSLPGQANYVLRRRDQTLLTQGTVTGFTSYTASGSTVAVAAAAQDAGARLAVLLADQIMARLATADLEP